MIKLHNLETVKTKYKKRVGRGIAGKGGKSAGRGTKGQLARTGAGNIPRRFEGGQSSLIQRTPKTVGIKRTAERTQTVKLSQLEKLTEEKISRRVLFTHKLIKNKTKPVKILFDKSINKKIKIVGCTYSKKIKEFLK